MRMTVYSFNFNIDQVKIIEYNIIVQVCSTQDLLNDLFEHDTYHHRLPETRRAKNKLLF